jgi:hypothetical protein
VPEHVSGGTGDRLLLNVGAQSWNGRDWQRHAGFDGVGVIAGYDPTTGGWSDARTTREEILASVQFEEDEAAAALRGATPQQIAAAEQSLKDGYGPLTVANIAGLKPAAVGHIRARMAARADMQQTRQAALGGQPPRFRREFRDRSPEVQRALDREFRRMLPADVHVRLANTIHLHGFEADEVVQAPNAFDPSAPWMLTVALERGPATAKIKGFHGIAAHILRGYGQGGLYTNEEWRLLLERAEKEGIKEEMRREPIHRADGTTISLWGAYLDTYARYGARRAEYMNQELVGRLAERWAAGRSYGKKIDTLLERLVKFLEAIRNALRGLGFQTADDVFERAYSGEIARRAEVRPIGTTSGWATRIRGEI